MLGAYADLMTKECDKCKDILDDKARFPVIREKKRQSGERGEEKEIWLAYHEGCR